MKLHAVRVGSMSLTRRSTTLNWMFKVFTFLAMGANLVSPMSSAHATTLPTISTAPNPCATSELPVWTPGSPTGSHYCITLTQYNASSVGTFDIGCPNGGTYNATVGVWDCNVGSSPTYSQQYLECLESGLAQVGVCDPVGLATLLIAGFLPGVSQLNKITSAIQLLTSQTAGWSTVCAAWSVSEPVSLTSVEQFAADSACTVLSLFGGNLTPPTIQFYQPQVNGLGLTINGVTLPSTQGATISSISCNFGDGSPVVKGWFPFTHTFPKSGSFNVAAVSTDSHGLTASATTTVVVSGTSQPNTPPSIELFQPQVNGRTVSFNGVTLPTSGGATIESIIWNFGDATAPVNAWFPSTHTYTRAGTYRVTALSTDSNGLSGSAYITVTVE